MDSRGIRRPAVLNPRVRIRSRVPRSPDRVLQPGSDSQWKVTAPPRRHRPTSSALDRIMQPYPDVKGGLRGCSARSAVMPDPLPPISDRRYSLSWLFVCGDPQHGTGRSCVTRLAYPVSRRACGSVGGGRQARSPGVANGSSAHTWQSAFNTSTAGDHSALGQGYHQLRIVLRVNHTAATSYSAAMGAVCGAMPRGQPGVFTWCHASPSPSGRMIRSTGGSAQPSMLSARSSPVSRIARTSAWSCDAMIATSSSSA